LVRGDLAASGHLGEQLLARATAAQDRALRVEANYVLGVTSFWVGKFSAAQRHLEVALADYEPLDVRAYITLFAQHPGVVCGVRLAYTLWYLGFADTARQQSDAAIALARELGHPFSLAYALYFSAWLANDSGDNERLRALAEELVALAIEHNLGYLRGAGEILLSWLRAQVGESGESGAALPEMYRALETDHATGQNLWSPYVLGLIARAHATTKQFQAGLAAIDEAIRMAAGMGAHFLDAELFRMKGELLFRQGGEFSVANRCLRSALATAREQEALALELRAQISLVRASEKDGKDAHEERDALGKIFARFPEKSGSADLREAAVLLKSP
jgi:tetratricopeptide (TPR) repeat protein